MSNESEKKRRRNATDVWRLYVAIVIGLYALFFVVRVFFFWSTLSTRHIIGALIAAAVNAAGMFALKSALDLGTDYAAVNDVLIVNWVVMAGTTAVSDWCWMIWLTVPAYLVYTYGATAMLLISSVLTQQTTPEQPANGNGRERKRNERRTTRRDQ